MNTCDDVFKKHATNWDLQGYMTVYSCNCSPSGAYKLDKFGLKYQVYKSRCNGAGIMSCIGSKEDFKNVMNAITSEFTVAPTFVKQLKSRHKIYAGPRKN